MKDTIILGIESSCDETAVAIVKNRKEVLSSVVASQIDVHKEFGGVVPEVASRIHVENISMVIDQALKKAGCTMEEIDAVAVTQGPGLVGCLHIGLQAAKTMAWTFHKPLVAVHHIAGHIFANEMVSDLQYPLLALVVSGGHTELVYLKDENSFEVLGETQDDAIGEAFDKVARVMGLPYPGGPQIDRLAKEGNNVYALAKPKTENPMDFSFSGLKSSVLQFQARCARRQENFVPADLACSFQETALEALLSRVTYALDHVSGIRHFVVAGGVAANSRLRTLITETIAPNYPQIRFTIPPLSCCTDNAAMIAIAGTIAYQHGRRSSFDIGAQPGMPLESE